jgi:hypothetical protein
MDDRDEVLPLRRAEVEHPIAGGGREFRGFRWIEIHQIRRGIFRIRRTRGDRGVVRHIVCGASVEDGGGGH